MSERRREVRSQSHCLLLRTTVQTDWQTDWNLTSDPQRVSPTHNILLPNTTTTQQQALFNTSEGRGQREGLFEWKCQGYKKMWGMSWSLRFRGVLVSPQMKKCSFKPSVWAAHATEMCWSVQQFICFPTVRKKNVFQASRSWETDDDSLMINSLH